MNFSLSDRDENILYRLDDSKNDSIYLSLISIKLEDILIESFFMQSAYSTVLLHNSAKFFPDFNAFSFASVKFFILARRLRSFSVIYS